MVREYISLSADSVSDRSLVQIREVRVSPVVSYAERYAKALASRRPLGRRGLSDQKLIP
ncbi:MAG: hypothetical protein ACFCU7_13200 [Pleurocapsa sp.]